MTAATQPPPMDTGTEATARAPRGDRLVGIALLVPAVMFTLVQVMAGQLIPPIAIPVPIYVALAIAVMLRHSRALLIVALVVTVLHVGFSAPFLASTLSHPDAPASFIPDALTVVAALTVVVGAIAALARARNRKPIAIGAVVLGVAAVAGSLVAAAGVESEAQQPGDVAVEAVQVEYPEQVQVASGGVVWVDNQDPFHHTFVVDGTDVHADVSASSAVRVPIELDAGTYRYYCDVPGHEAMEGELAVE